MNVLRINMGFGPSFWALAFVFLRVSARSRGLVISCSKIGQKPAKTKYLKNICANVKTTNNWTEVRMVSDFDIKFMPLSKLNRG